VAVEQAEEEAEAEEKYPNKMLLINWYFICGAPLIYNKKQINT
jgi:hypothetical protein